MRGEAKDDPQPEIVNRGPGAPEGGKNGPEGTLKKGRTEFPNLKMVEKQDCPCGAPGKSRDPSTTHAVGKVAWSME